MISWCENGFKLRKLLHPPPPPPPSLPLPSRRALLGFNCTSFYKGTEGGGEDLLHDWAGFLWDGLGQPWIKWNLCCLLKFPSLTGSYPPSWSTGHSVAVWGTETRVCLYSIEIVKSCRLGIYTYIHKKFEFESSFWQANVFEISRIKTPDLCRQKLNGLLINHAVERLFPCRWQWKAIHSESTQ